MNKIKLFVVVLVGVFSLVWITSVFAKPENARQRSGEQHRSAVANVVQELIKVADRDGEIGGEVRVVAQAEKDQSEVAKEKMDRVENRSGFKVFFIGTDYKNLGELRSEMVTTQNHLDRLNKAMERASSTTVKEDLEAQIKELEIIKNKADGFIKANENKFSLFGWLVRLFSK